MTTLAWTFSAKDQITHAARAAGRSVEGLRASLGRLRGDRTQLGTGGPLIPGLSSARTQINGIGDSIGTVLRGVGRVAGIATAIVGTAVAIGGAFAGVAAMVGRSVAEMIRFRESSVVTLGTLMRGSDRSAGSISRVGGAAFRQTQAIARITPGNERDVIRSRGQLAAAGFRGREEERVLAGSLDVGALNPEDSTAGSRFVRALGQIRGRGRLQGEELNQLGELGIGREAIFAEIAQRRGMRETGAARTRAVEQLMQRGQITGAEGNEAALAAVQGMTGQRLGGFAAAQGATLAGSISNLEESVFGLITGINGLENLPGVRAFAASLTAIGNALNGSSAAGQRLQAVMGGLINEVGGMFAGVFTPARIEGLVTTVARVLPPLFEAMRLIGGAFFQGLMRGLAPVLSAMSGLGGTDGTNLIAFGQLFGETLGRIVGFSASVVAGLVAVGGAATALVGSFMTVVEGFYNLPTTIITFLGGLGTSLGDTLFTTFSGLGTRMVDGLVSGITGGVSRVTGAVTGLAGSAITSVRDTLGIHSPSAVFAELGGNTAEGFERGIHGRAAGVRSAVSAMVAPPDLAGAGNAAAGRGTFQIFIEGAGREASAIVDEIEERVGLRFDRLALAGGA